MVMLEEYREIRAKLEKTELALRKQAAEKIKRLNTATPKWTLIAIAKKLGISKGAVDLLKAADSRVGIGTVTKVLETDFES